MKKKLFILGLLLPFFLVGCGSQEDNSFDDSSNIADSSNNDSAKSSGGKVSSSGSSSKQSSSNRTSSSKESESSIPNYVLHGKFNGSSTWTDKQMTYNSSTEYMIIGVQLSVNDEFKIHMDGNYWYGYSTIKKYAGIPSGLVKQSSNDDNIIVLVAGTYDIYCDKNASDGGNIYLAKTDGGGSGSSPSTVSVTGITLDRGGKLLTYRDETFSLNATVYPSNATNKEVIWTSDDTSIAEVTTAGRIKAKEKTGVAIITARTADGNKTATCYIYVTTDGIPDFYLSGTIGGRSISSGTYTYAGIPLSTGRYLIPSVQLNENDKINVRGNKGHVAILKNKYNQTYEYKVNKDCFVDIFLNVYDDNYNYLNVVEK